VLPPNGVVELVGTVEAPVPLCPVVVERPEEPVGLVADVDKVPVITDEEVGVDVSLVVPRIPQKISEIVCKKARCLNISETKKMLT
jgi:hypothetical protein